MAGLRYLGSAALAMLYGIPAAHAAERSFTVTDFDRIRVEGPYAIEVTTGRGTTARASGAREAIEQVSVQVQGRTLVIRADRSRWGGFPGEKAGAGPVIIRVSTGELRTILLYGSGRMTVDRIRGPRLELMIQGSGRIDIARVETDRLDIGMTGSGSAKLAGAAKSVNALVRGSAALDGTGLIAGDLVLNSESASDVTLSARTSAKVQSTGAGNVAITGNAACAVTATGAGTVECGR